MMYLKQSTAVDIPVGPFLDETDGKTAETALTITQPDIRLKKNGGAWAQKNAAQTLSHEEAGWYEVSLDTTDTNTLGHLVIAIHESGALPVWREFMVVPANVYDSLVGGSDTLDVQVTGIGADVVTASALAADAVAEIADGVWDEQASGHVAAGSFGQRNAIADSGTAQGGGGSSITLRAGASAVTDFYTEMVVLITGGTGAGQSAVIKGYNGTTKVATIFDGYDGSRWGTAPDNTSIYVILPGGAASGKILFNAENAHLYSAGAYSQTLYEFTTNDTAQGGAAGSITLAAGESAVDDFFNNQIIQIVAGTGAGQARIISDYVGATKVATVNGNWTTAPDNTSDYVIRPFGAIPGATAPTAGEVADAVWDEATAGHATAGTFGKAAADILQDTGTDIPASLTTIDDFLDTEVAAIKAKTDNLPAAPAATGDIPSAATIADAVWDEATAGHAGAGSTGKALSDVLDDTGTSGVVVGSIANGAITANAIAAAALTAAKFAAGALDAAALATDAANEIADAILGRQMTEGYAADGVAPTLAQALFLIMQGCLEFSISGTTVTVKKLDGTTTAATFTLNDATNPTSRTRAT